MVLGGKSVFLEPVKKQKLSRVKNQINHTHHKVLYP